MFLCVIKVELILSQKGLERVDDVKHIFVAGLFVMCQSLVRLLGSEIERERLCVCVCVCVNKRERKSECDGG